MIELNQQIETATWNLALAKNPQIFQALEWVLTEMYSRQEELDAELSQLHSQTQSMLISSDVVQQALEHLAKLPDLAEDPENLAAIGLLFRRINLQMFLRFHRVRVKKRTLNRLTGGVLTIGTVEPPVQKYTGPTGRRGLQGHLIATATTPGSPICPNQKLDSDKAAKSSGICSRGDRTPLELFLAGLRGWDGGLRHQIPGISE